MAHKTVARPKPPAVKDGAGTHDALDLLATGHVEIDGMFRAYQRRRRQADRLEKGKLAQGLISKIEETPADDPLFDSMIEVLATYVARHVKVEEEQIFPKVRHSRLDLLGTGERLAARRLELSTAHLDRQAVRRARTVMGGKAPSDQATSRRSIR